MKILAADDEALALEMLVDSIKEVKPDAEIFEFSKPSKLLEFAAENQCDVAFLDIHMRGMTGVELAKKLKEAYPKINIIFVTGFDQYTGDAMMMKASGYIMKPVTPEKIKEELDDLRHPIEPKSNAVLRVQCFGNFDVFTPDGSPVHFERSKSKEVFAYLVHRHGSSCTIKEIAAALFEDEPYDSKQQAYLQKIMSAMMKSLKNIGAEKVVNKKYNSLSVNTAMLDCDYYRFEELDAGAVNSYMNEYMSQYYWAEFM
ncbi:response regulator [Ruminococcus sp.]|uniref:response regulator n=1 Tax=Ruminococcus sp. TaxID=41978 RepID=UPI0038655418